MDEELPYRPCVGSGHCCKVAPCVYGAPGPDGACVFLEPWFEATIETLRYRCGRYEEIRLRPGSFFSPAFGQGCCSPMFNVARNAIVRELKREK